MNIAFIGLGLMGRPMAANLVKAGHALVVKDLRQVEIAGAQWSEKPARDADVIFTSLPGPKEVEAISIEILRSAKPGAAWFDLSSNSPEVVRKLHSECAEKKIQLLDAPVSGATPRTRPVLLFGTAVSSKVRRKSPTRPRTGCWPTVPFGRASGPVTASGH